MALYKKGDRVIVRPDLQVYETCYSSSGKCSDSVTESMVGLAGMVVTIESCVPDTEKYKVEEDIYRWNWVDGMFDGLESEQQDFEPSDIPLDAMLF